VWALTQCRVRYRLVPLLRERWDVEDGLAVKATVLKALSELDPRLAAGLAAGVLAGAADAGLLLIAARACVAARMAWDERLHQAATAWMADGQVLPGFWWGDQDPFDDLVIALAAQGNADGAVRLVVTGLAYPVAGIRRKAAFCAGELARAYRSPAGALAGPLSAVAGDPDAGSWAISVLGELGEISAAAASRVAAVADVRSPDRHADEALACLIKLGDPRATQLLARDLGHRPCALAVAASQAWNQPPPLPCDPALLAAVRERLRSNGPPPCCLRCCGPGGRLPRRPFPKWPACCPRTSSTRPSRWRRSVAPSWPVCKRSAWRRQPGLCTSGWPQRSRCTRSPVRTARSGPPSRPACASAATSSRRRPRLPLRSAPRPRT
jgi:hypothetical protein